MVKSTLIPGKFFSFLFGVLFGIILVVGGVVGVGFYAYKKVPASKVLSLIPGEEEWLSATYAEKTAEQLIKEFSTLKADTLTLSKLAEISPALDEKLTDLLDKVGDTGIVAIDKDVLYQTPVTSLTGELKNVLIISASLNSLGEKLGFSLPDMPLIKGGTEGNEVWIYTAVNDNADKKIEKAIEKGEYAYYTKSSEYSATPVTTLTSYNTYTIENVDGSGEYLKTSGGNFIYLKVKINESKTVYEKIKSDDKNIVSESPYTFKTPDLYIKNGLDSTEEYSKITSDPTGTVDLYEVPVKYAYQHLFAKVGEDFVQATNEDFSVKDEYKNVHLYSKVEVYTQVATEDLTDQFKQDNVLYVKSNGIGSLPITVGISALSKALDMNALSLNQVGEYFGVTLENDLLADVMDVPFANLSDSMNSIIDNMALADVIDLNSESSPILLYIAYGVEGVDYTVDGTQIIPITPPRSINGVMDCIDNLRIGHIIPAESGSHGLIKAIQDWSLDDFNNPDKINSLKLSDVIEIGEDAPQIMKAIKDCSVGGLSDAISTLTIEDMIGEVDESETILFAIKDCTIDTLSTAIQELSLQDLFADKVYKHHPLTTSEYDLLLTKLGEGNLPPLYVWETGEYVKYDGDNPYEKLADTAEDTELYIDYTIGYDGTGTLPDLTADNYTNEAYKKVHLFAWENVEDTFKYVDASEITGWALPDGYSDSKTYYYKDNDGYKAIDPPVYDSEIDKNIYNKPVLYYLDENENVQKVELLPEHLGIKAGYENKVLFTKMFIAESDSNHEYNFANLYYYDIEAQAYKRVEAAYERTDGSKTHKFSVGAEYQGKTLFTHGNPVGIWKYLLMHPDDGYETIGSINKIGEQVSHACSNINKATINALYADGLITIEGDTSDLATKYVDHDFDADTPKKALGDLTIGEMLTYLIKIT